jgi:ribose transport system ATP-binding protein
MKKLQTISLRKTYPGTIALKNISAEFEGGKVHAIIGKNGSGKSTLIKIISGAEQPTAGTLKIDGTEISMANPAQAFAAGIATVYQELSLVPELSIAENIFLGRLPKHDRFPLRINWKKAFTDADRLLREMGISLSSRRKIESLSVGQQQVIEIVKAMSFNPLVLMLDEPTSALAQHEVKNLFLLIKRLREKGVIVLYISHRLQELYNIADTVTVLRDGELIGTIPIEKATPKTIVSMMFGEARHAGRPENLPVSDETVLEIRSLTRKPDFSEVDISVRRGEVLGIAGMLGAGRTELLRAIFGADPYDEGELIFHGQPIAHPTPKKMKKLGMAMVPENRKQEGLILDLSIRANLCTASLETIGRKGRINRKMEEPFVRRQVQDLEIKAADTEYLVSVLSGGNQQKVVVGNWLNTRPSLVIFDEPSRGIDVQAKQQIFEIMWNLSRDGISSIMVSSELEELLEVCHRILIMKQGRIVGEVLPEEITLEELYTACMEV